MSLIKHKGLIEEAFGTCHLYICCLFIIFIILILIIQGLGSIYLFRNNDEVESFDRYSNTGYKSLRSGHQYEIGARECDGFISNTFGSASSSQGYSLRYEGDFYVTFYALFMITIASNISV